MAVIAHGQKTSVKKKGGKSNFSKTFSGEPGKAALYSLLLPGAGQVYNKRYWKVPLVLAGEGYAIYHLSNTTSKYKTLRAEHETLINAGAVQSEITAAFNSKQEARYQREIAWIVVGGAHLLNVLDAFIDRHLINFDTSPDLSDHRLTPKQYYNPVQVELFSISLPLHSR